MTTHRLAAALLVALLACDEPELAGTPLADELVGQWQTAIAVETFANPWGGRLPFDPTIYDPLGSVLGIAIALSEDGGYNLVWLWRTQYLGVCYRVMSWDEWGAIAVDGDRWTFRPSTATFRLLDSCSPELTTEEPGDTATQTLTVTRAGDTLRLRYPSGSTLVLDRLIR
jgi:hypothetical protein